MREEEVLSLLSKGSSNKEIVYRFSVNVTFSDGG